jgi:CRISPR/Cas system CSM-associated protein Csm3 (group 7 of RAMP superfamily)
VEVRDGVAIDRDTETAADGRKYDFEVVPRETAFDLQLRVDNATAGELGLLFLGLREFTNGDAWVGGNTSRGLGLVRIVWDEFEVVEGRTGLIAYLQRGRGQVLTEEAARQAFIAEKTRAFLETLNGEGGRNAQEAA